MNDNAITTTTKEQPIERISAHMYREESIKRFSVMLGEKQAQRFVASVLTAVMADQKLQACTPLSIYLSAVRAATLGLSVDPAYGQAYLVAYGNVCTFMPGYKGFRDKASDNGIACHVDEIYDNEKVLTHRMTGEVKIEGENGFWRPASTSAWSDANGHRIAGFLASWWSVKGALSGEKQYLYMTVEQIEEYAQTHSPAYDVKSSPWNKNKLTRKEMMKKTVLKTLLRKTAPLNPVVSRLLMEIEDEQAEARNAAFEGIDIKGTEEQEPKEKRTREQNMRELGFDSPSPVTDEHWNDWVSLCERADALKIEHANPKRETTTDEDLEMGFFELLEYVKAAEWQAGVGTEAQS
jgi:phage RecT family recombinase